VEKWQDRFEAYREHREALLKELELAKKKEIQKELEKNAERIANAEQKLREG
jgi:hypothetical protein